MYPSQRLEFITSTDWSLEHCRSNALCWARNNSWTLPGVPQNNNNTVLFFLFPFIFGHTWQCSGLIPDCTPLSPLLVGIRVECIHQIWTGCMQGKHSTRCTIYHSSLSLLFYFIGSLFVCFWVRDAPLRGAQGLFSEVLGDFVVLVVELGAPTYKVCSLPCVPFPHPCDLLDSLSHLLFLVSPENNIVVPTV